MLSARRDMNIDESPSDSNEELSAHEKLSLRKEALRRLLSEDEDLDTDFMLRAVSSGPAADS